MCLAKKPTIDPIFVHLKITETSAKLSERWEDASRNKEWIQTTMSTNMLHQST